MMKHVASEKSSLAWFKLAEFVTRGEKERALSIYRLLSHSLKSEALAAQLEGDLLQAFDDERALDAYRRAALLYQHENDIVQAIILYEQISSLAPDLDDVLLTLLAWYQRLEDHARTADIAHRLIALYTKTERFTEAHELIVQTALPDEQKQNLHERFVSTLLTSPMGRLEEQLIKTHICRALDYYLLSMQRDDDQEGLQRFLSLLGGMDDTLHTYACDYVKSSQAADN